MRDEELDNTVDPRPFTRTRLPRSGQRQEALRVLMLARRSAVDVRRVALVQLRSVIVTSPEELREELRRLPVGELIERCSRFRRSSTRTPDQLAAILVLRTLARRIQAATREADQLEREILAHVRALAPQLLDEPGVGPIVAAQTDRRPGHTQTASAQKQPSPASPASHRCRPRAATQPATGSAAAATANSTAPSTPSSSTAATTTPPPSDYIARRIAEGKTRREAIRLLKRYLARHLYRVMQNSTPLTT